MLRNWIVVLGLTFALDGLMAPQAQAQRGDFVIPQLPANAWRGRIYIRRGPFMDVYRGHWGNGVTDNGLALGTQFINGTVAVANQYLAQQENLTNTAGALDDADSAALCPLDPPMILDQNAAPRAEVLADITKRQRRLFDLLDIPEEKWEARLKPVTTEPLPTDAVDDSASDAGGDDPSAEPPGEQV